MGISSSVPSDTTQEWGSDFFGTLNDLPSEPVGGISQVLETMSSASGFRDAHDWLLPALGVARDAAVLEAGCGTGVLLADLLAVVGSGGRVVGVDPTKLFIDQARRRAEQLGAANARYEVGDIRSLPFAGAEFDAAFCDKVLIHAGPAPVALSEMARVTRAGGHVGAIEWSPFFVLSTTRPELGIAFNAIFPSSTYEYAVSANLARHFHTAGLEDVQTRAFLAHTDSLDAHPFWRAFILHQLPMFAHAGLIEEATANALAADLEALDARGEFSASFIVQAAVGVKPADG